MKEQKRLSQGYVKNKENRRPDIKAKKNSFKIFRTQREINKLDCVKVKEDGRPNQKVVDKTFLKEKEFSERQIDWIT